MSQSLARLKREIKNCRVCAEQPLGTVLPHEPRPVFQISARAKLAICGQAPGTLVHASGKPFTDPSGERLRRWTGLNKNVFYDQTRVAVIPMGFCFPGQNEKGGDLPPRRECAPKWRNQLFQLLDKLELILLVGGYAIKWHLPGEKKSSLTETVSRWETFLDTSSRPRFAPMPHPSWRNNHWLKKNLWYEGEYMPVLRREIALLLDLPQRPD